MKNILLLGFLIIFLSSMNAFSQLDDDFSDGDFTNNPAWTGDITEFVVANNQLRSAGPNATATLHLSTSNTLMANTEWRFMIDLPFAPSTTNLVRVYLVSNQANLEGSLQGYYIEIGQTGDDFIRFFRQNATTSTLLFTGSTAFPGNVKVRIKIQRDNSGNWEIAADATGGQNFVSEGAPILDNTFTNTAHFGVMCKHTSTRKDQFFFDDFFIRNYIADTEPPTLQNINIVSANHLDLLFSEAVSLSSAENTANYSVNNSIGFPQTVTRDASNFALVRLTFSNNFVSDKLNTLTIKDVEDLNSNLIDPNPVISEFTFIQTFSPAYQELIISEIMADPTGNARPLNGLPDAEFVEIHNRSNKILSLKNCKFEDESSSKILPDIIIRPGEYFIICDQNMASVFQLFGKTIGITGFPALTNSGERLSLKNAANELLFTIKYADSWYQNSTKADGGWTLEMIDVNNPCGDFDNWRASENERGGTPGKINSVNAQKPDLTAPKLLRAEAIDNQHIRLTFNEKMDAISLQNGNYQINKGIKVNSVALESPEYRKAVLNISPVLALNETYHIQTDNVRDCNKNLIGNMNTAVFGLPQSGNSQDIILNEVLFNPRVGGNDFVELYNNSSKFINLKNWKLANAQNGLIANQKVISTDDFILTPNSYLLLTQNGLNIKANYPLAKDENFWLMASLPSYNDDEGSVILINDRDQLMEKFDYSDKFHYPLLDDKEGVSLERVSFSSPTNDKNSWQSASASVGYATPGYQNSQTRKERNFGATVSINPKVFTPDGDSQDDFTNIDLEFEQSGYMASILIYDRQGREIRRLAENQLLGTHQSSIVWDGTNNSGERVKMGYYLVLVRVFNSNGEEKVFKETVVLGSRF